MFKIVAIKDYISKAKKKYNVFTKLHINVNIHLIGNNKFNYILILNKKQFGKKSENLKW